MQNIPLYQPAIGEEEKRFVNDCLDSTWISSRGKYVDLFEQRFAEFVGAENAIAVCNGTVALHLCALAAEVGPGDEVIVPTLTYVASANAVSYTGAKPVLVDSKADTWQLDPAEVESKITPATKAIMPVHLYGQAADMDSIRSLSENYGLYVIEDCAEAIGTQYRGTHVGTLGHIASFSFFGNKTITTGEGGMVVTNDAKVARQVAHLKGQGLVPGREYQHDVIGYNYRMTNICAALGVAQLESANIFIERKRRVAEMYKELLSSSDVIFHDQHGKTIHSFWMSSILVRDKNTRDGLREHLAQNGIETRPVFPPLHTMRMYKTDGQFPVAENLASRGLNLPSWPGLSDEQVEYIASQINSYLESR